MPLAASEHRDVVDPTNTRIEEMKLHGLSDPLVARLQALPVDERFPLVRDSTGLPTFISHAEESYELDDVLATVTVNKLVKIKISDLWALLCDTSVNPLW